MTARCVARHRDHVASSYRRLRAVIAPYDFDTFRRTATSSLEAPFARPPDGTNVHHDVFSRSSGARGPSCRSCSSRHISIRRRASRALLRLFRRQARPRPGVDHGRHARYPFLLLAIVIASCCRTRSARNHDAAWITVVTSRSTSRGPHTRSASRRSVRRGCACSWRGPLTVIRKYVFFNVVQNVPRSRRSTRRIDSTLAASASSVRNQRQRDRWIHVNRAVSDAAPASGDRPVSGLRSSCCARPDASRGA